MSPSASETFQAYLARLAEARKAVVASIVRPPVEWPLEMELPYGRAVTSREFGDIVRELRAVEATKWFRIRASVFGLVRRAKPPKPAPTPIQGEWFDDYSRWIAEIEEIGPGEEPFVEAAVRKLAQRPTIGVVASLKPGHDLSRLKASLEAQFYPNWVLVIRLGEQVDREQIEAVAGNPAIAQTDEEVAAALQRAGAEWFMAVDAADVLPRQALFVFADALAEHADAELVYADEDSIDPNGQRHSPDFKPDWSEPLLEQSNYLGAATLFRTTPAGVPPETGHWDWTIRYAKGIAASAIVHLPFVLLHRGAGSEPPGHKVPGHIDPPDPAPLVSIVIPTRDQLELLQTCIESIDKLTAYRPFEYVIVDNGTQDKKALAYLESLKSRADVTVIRDDSPFNYSALNNKGAYHARGEILALLNNDLEIQEPDWMTHLVAHNVNPATGIVGTRLLYADGTIQHAGVVVGMSRRYAVHQFRGMPGHGGGYMGRANMDQWITAVTGACMFIRKSVFEELGGFDEEQFPIILNDIDLCLKARHAGYQNVYAGSTWCTHHESKSRGFDTTDEKRLHSANTIAEFAARWGAGYRDPFYNPNLALSLPLHVLTYSPRMHKPWYR